MLKWTGLLAGFLLLAALAFHLWFTRYARQLLEDYVRRESKGKIELRIGQLRYQYFKRNLVLRDAELFSTDSTAASVSYRFRLPELRMKLQALWPLLREKKILIDSLFLRAPEFDVTRRPGPADTVRRKGKDISIPYEMGRVYNSIRDALQLLKVTRFGMEGGTFTLRNARQPSATPLRISQIDLQIDNLLVDSSEPGRPLFSDNIILQCRQQQLVFPDGRHSLAFKQFRINLRQQLVAFDSCVIQATPSDSTRTSFRVEMDALALSHIDFDTLYRHDVIKADSVYCINPRFRLLVDQDREMKKGPPRLEEIVEQLTGDLVVNRVVVANADFDIRTVKNGIPNTYTFHKNSFEMEGLRIAQEEKNPIRVRSFAMAIRDYENFIRDSTYSIRFDSVLLRNDRITLSNFLFEKTRNARVINRITVPAFSLEGLSWDDLLFNKRLVARKAILYQPAIDYQVNPDRKNPQQTLLQSLGVVNEYMDLGHLDVVDGQIRLRLGGGLEISLDKADLAIASHSLLQSRRMAGVKQSLESIHFHNGTIRTPAFRAYMEDLYYDRKKSDLRAGLLEGSDSAGTVRALFRQLQIRELIADETAGFLLCDSLSWSSAQIRLRSHDSTRSFPWPFLDLAGIRGHDTKLELSGPRGTGSAWLNDLQASRLRKPTGGNWQLQGLSLSGRDLMFEQEGLLLAIRSFEGADGKPSTLTELDIRNNKPGTEWVVRVPRAGIIPSVKNWLGNLWTSDSVWLEQPRFQVIRRDPESRPGLLRTPRLVRVEKLSLDRPSLRWEEVNGTDTTRISWESGKGSFNRLDLGGIEWNSQAASGFSVKQAGAFISGLNWYHPPDAQLSTGNGSLRFSLRDFSLPRKTETGQQWQAHLEDLRAEDLPPLPIGKKDIRLLFEEAELADLPLGNQQLKNLRLLLGGGQQLRLDRVKARLETPGYQLRLYNGSYRQEGGWVRADSLLMNHRLSPDSFRATRRYQQDYMQLQTGKLEIRGLNLPAALQQRHWKLDELTADGLKLTDIKDKTLPLAPGVKKPMPVEIIRQIPLPFEAGLIRFRNAAVNYTEISARTGLPATVSITRLQVHVRQVRNHDFKPGDSLYVEAEGYLVDTVWTHLRLAESYTDTAAGFRMNARMKAGNLPVLNPVLVPLASVELLGGDVDTLRMQALGNRTEAWGQMRMPYRNLRVNLLPELMQKKRIIGPRLTAFLAETFLLKRQNRSRSGWIYFRRNPERSALNYLIKIAVSGMTSSMGISPNKRKIRTFLRQAAGKGIWNNEL